MSILRTVSTASVLCLVAAAVAAAQGRRPNGMEQYFGNSGDYYRKARAGRTTIRTPKRIS